MNHKFAIMTLLTFLLTEIPSVLAHSGPHQHPHLQDAVTSFSNSEIGIVCLAAALSYGSILGLRRFLKIRKKDTE